MGFRCTLILMLFVYNPTVVQGHAHSFSYYNDSLDNNLYCTIVGETPFDWWGIPLKLPHHWVVGEASIAWNRTGGGSNCNSRRRRWRIPAKVSSSFCHSHLRISFLRLSHVVLTQGDYYTIPSVDELDDLVEDGSCVVIGFTIGRRGFGEIHFPDKTNVFGMNLDQLG